MSNNSVNAVFSDLEKKLEETSVSRTILFDGYFSRLFDTLSDSVLVHQGKKIIFANAAAAKLYGAESAESLIGMSAFEFVHPDEKEEVEKRSQEMMANGMAKPLIEQRRIRLDGQQVEVEVAVTPIDWEGGRSIVVVSRDISARKKIERALRDSEDHLSNVTANIPGMVYQRVLYPDGHVEYPYISDGVMDLLGIDAQSAMKNPSLLIEIIHPEDRVRVYDAITRSAETFEQLDFEFKIIQPGGAEIWVHGLSRPHKRDDGAIVWDALMFDITARKKVEIKLRESEERYRTFLEDSPDAIYVHSNDKIVYGNPALVKLFGASSIKDLAGRSARSLFHPEEWEKLKTLRRQTTETGSIKTLTEFRFCQLDGSVFYGEATAATIDWDGVPSIFVNIRGIDHRKEIEHKLETVNAELSHQADELQKSNSDLEQFAYIASHDLQEPLRMVSGYCQLLKRRYKDKLDEDANEFIEFAVEGAGRMQQLISDILMYSRVGSRAKPLEKLESQEIFNDALANLSVITKETDAVITSDELPEIMGDRTQLGQLFQNLLGNAIKFRGDKTPEIHVSAALNGTDWEFSVSDNGIGIEPEHRERIFLIFQRLHTRAEYEGTGIGLAVCQKIIVRHGGTLRVEGSESGGSKFFFNLPGLGD